ncbi:hypothetical protein FKM82_007734 [Ascaphus truei]
MLKGLFKAHELYGKLPWSEIISKAAAVARDGFNVTHDLAGAVNGVRDQNLSDGFRETFFPDGQPLLAGAFARRPDLAAILDAVAAGGVEAYYSGNLTQEMVSEVSAYGGVLTEEDFSNYSVTVEKPVQTVYQGNRHI